jgi:RNA polymerase sigma-70 factor (ECF subfamily)
VRRHFYWCTGSFTKNCISIFCKRPALSEELVQLTYIKLWQYRQNLNDQLPISQQIFRIAKTTLIDVLRKKAANRLVSFDNVLQLDVVEEETALHDDHQVTLVQESLCHLPPMQRKIVAFRLEGMTNKEIAGQMAISKKTVENQVNRAIREIRKKTGISVVLMLSIFGHL